MSQIPTPHSVWMTNEMVALITWLEEPENLKKTKKGSGVSKKTNNQRNCSKNTNKT
ncbi:hypothetical protein L873DRAFT_1804045 [Choiromyces venosus 120613-1]|uniref:Uncharacterized protein n=1 Tax=Choiromyces venosus 120613-1 TaxID=1336337 RepID=A0A3N4JS34_9PEZI|nr:hypothetical protein L873DRAFT_1804045 [Choiromyces venosus 120613-1]